MSLKITGKLPTGKYRQLIQQSSYYKNGSFQNFSPTPMKPEGVSYWKLTKEFMKKHPETSPPKKLPFVRTDLKKLDATGPVLVWFGHSSYLLRIENKNFLIDPVFSGYAAPFSFMVKAFPGSDEYKAADMPAIDYLILTHDHYDHLDFRAIRKLKSKVGKVICSLGIGAHLKYWGVEEEKITELEWWQSTALDNNMELTAAPARHFSGRGIKRGQSLWSSFILKTPSHSLYLGGDSGYDTHFKEIGEKYGPFDLALLESGQYNTMWPLIHMMPEQTVQAAIDLKAKALMPVHWGKFKLGMHPWDEPIKRIIKKAVEVNSVAAAEKPLTIVTPMNGESVFIGKQMPAKHWWEL